MNAELFQGVDEELFEIISFSDNAACVFSVNNGIYSAVAKPYIQEYRIDWRFKYDYESKVKALKATKELRKMYVDFETKRRVMDISSDIDRCISLSSEGYHYDLSGAYDGLISSGNTSFDIACTTALVVKQHNQVGRDMRYNSVIVNWANEFLKNNDIDFDNFKNLPLCHTHAVVMNSFAETVKERFESENLEISRNGSLSL